VDSPESRVVLDKMQSPIGLISLTVRRQYENVLVGVSFETQPGAAIGLHGGSREHYVEGSCSIYQKGGQGWGVAFGAVAPEIERVAVRSDDGEMFPARIIPLPPEFGEDYRAAWGVAERCREYCALLGYRDDGKVITEDVVRRGRPPIRLDPTPDLSAADRLTRPSGDFDRALDEETRERLRERWEALLARSHRRMPPDPPRG